MCGSVMTVERDQLKKFTDLGLAEPILRAIAAEGYASPTPIQAEVIPSMLTGKDLIGVAQTGTGKTASFVLPLLHRIAKQHRSPGSRKCSNLILTPTRELAQQIADNIRSYSKFMKVSVTVVVGGVKPGPQIRSLACGADIVVATPGRLLDHISTDALSLGQTTCVILDEADQMLDLGFLPAIRKIMQKLPGERQTVLMSATMPPKVRKLAHDFQVEPEEIAVAAVSRPIERIAQSIRHVPSAGKRDLLVDILSDGGDMRAIVFTRTKRGADRVSRHLDAHGLSSAAIHGNKSQPQRERTLASFRSGRTAVLVATDIAARGIDVDDVTHVINFDLPNVPEAYVHRIGRTARAGRAGIAISLCDPSELDLLRDIERLIGNKIDGFSSGQNERRAGLPQKEKGRRNAARRTQSGKTRLDEGRCKKVKGKAVAPSFSTERTPGPDTPMAGLNRMFGNIGPTTVARDV